MILRVNPDKGFNWNKVAPTYVHHEQLNELLKQLDADEHIHRRCFTHICIKSIKNLNTWCFNDGKNRKEIRVCRFVDVEINGDEVIDSMNFERYIWLKDYAFKSADAFEDTGTGKDAYDAIEEKFNHFNNTKTLALESIFSGRKYKKLYTMIKKCVPVQIQYMNSYYSGKDVKNVFKADVSSAFPTQIMKDLPTLHDCKVVNGKAEPSAEYPFAFYVNSHHIKTYDGYDSKDLHSVYYSEYYSCIDDVKEEVTILCKKMSEKHHKALAEAFKDCYDHRKDDSMNKFIMNASIGYFHRNNNPALSFISAIVILRCNIDMLRRCAKLIDEGNEILFIATDSIAWIGNLSDVATDDKYLGSFTYEAKNTRFIGYSAKAYQYIDNHGNVITRYAGVKKEESRKLKFGEINYKSADRKYYVWKEHDERFHELVKYKGDN